MTIFFILAATLFVLVVVFSRSAKSQKEDQSQSVAIPLEALLQGLEAYRVHHREQSGRDLPVKIRVSGEFVWIGEQEYRLLDSDTRCFLCYRGRLIGQYSKDDGKWRFNDHFVTWYTGEIIPVGALTA